MKAIIAGILTGILTAVIMACVDIGGAANGQENAQASSDGAYDGNWQLLEAEGIEVRKVALNIDGDLYHTDAGCNQISGVFDGSFKSGMSTMMGCPDDYERRYTDILFSVHHFVHYPDLGQLVLTGANGKLTFQKMIASNHLEGNWVVHSVHFNGAVVSGADQPHQTLRFSGGKINGYDGCNRVFGDYTLEEKDIRFNHLGATKRACQSSGNYDWPSGFMRALEEARRVEIVPDRIDLHAADGARLMVLTRE